jgi:hypothetical protein
LKDNAANLTEAFQGAASHFMGDIIICNADGEQGTQANILYSTD